MNLSSVGFQPVDNTLLPTADWISALPRLEQRKYRFSSLLAKGSSSSYESAPRTWALQSLLSPSKFTASESRPGHVGGVTSTVNRFIDHNKRFESSAKVTATEETKHLDVSLAFRSIGYKSTAIPGLTNELGVPFDERTGTIPNDAYGRVVDAMQGPQTPRPDHIPGYYCAGWVKRGPTGVIASTMDDAFASADTVLNDWEAGMEFLDSSSSKAQAGDGRGWDGVVQDPSISESVRRVSWEDWKRIDEEERRRGRAKGKPREKFLSTKDMLKVLD